MTEQSDSGGTELGRYLRARRAQLSPGEVGLPVHGLRRTPGLRREELATLAGISNDYTSGSSAAGRPAPALR